MAKADYNNTPEDFTGLSTSLLDFTSTLDSQKIPSWGNLSTGSPSTNLPGSGNNFKLISRSKSVFFHQFPVPKNFKANFIYNFFETNELVEDAYAGITTNSTFPNTSPGLQNFYSREIKLEWELGYEKTADTGDDFDTINEDVNVSLINNSLNSSYTDLPLQDVNIINSIEFKVKDSLASYYDLGLINDNSPITKELLDAISQNQHNYLNYVPNSTFDQLTSNAFLTSINNEDLNALLENLEYNQASQYSSTLKDIVAGSTNNNNNNTVVKGAKSTKKRISKAIVGFLIDKYKIIDGNYSFFKSIFVSPNQRSYSDRQVTYGKNYAYSTRIVFKITIPTLNVNNVADYYDFYMAGEQSEFVVVNCTENVAPPPPVNLSFTWNDKTKKLNLRWGAPIGSQRDIKGYLIFKRNSIYEPFELLKMYDFNNSNPRIPLSNELLKTGKVEFITELVNGELRPKYTYDDFDFVKEKSVIYAVASYDAHGLYSNLSAQVLVSVDLINNTLKKDLISRIGAPISYPNLMIEKDLFLDSLIIDGYTSAKIYFDPDCDKISNAEATVNGARSNDEKSVYSVAFSPNDDTSKYVFTFLNVATQEFEKYNLKIVDSDSMAPALSPSYLNAAQAGTGPVSTWGAGNALENINMSQGFQINSDIGNQLIVDRDARLSNRKRTISSTPQAGTVPGSTWGAGGDPLNVLQEVIPKTNKGKDPSSTWGADNKPTRMGRRY